MAERRMFTQKVTEADNFTTLPPTTQCLYFHLCMNADDDGFSNKIRQAMFNAHADQNDFEMLVNKRFIIPFDSGVIVIKHWRMHNYIRNDRYHETSYVEEKSQLLLKENGVYTESVDKVDTIGIPNGYQMDTEVRLGKDSIDKDIYKTSEKSDELDLSFEKIYRAYPKKAGKTKAKQIYKALLTKGRKIDGKTVKFTHEDICAGLNVYYNDKTEPNNGEIGDTKYWMNFDTLMNRIQDYVERREELDE